MTEVLSVEQMYGADRATMKLGISGETLMEAAGAEVARAIVGRFGVRPTAILCTRVRPRPDRARRRVGLLDACPVIPLAWTFGGQQESVCLHFN